MFTKKIEISRVKKRIDAMRDKCIDTSYLCFQYAERTGSKVGTNYSVTFEDGMGYALFDRFENELSPVHRFIAENGSNGKNTLLAFAGTTSPDAQKAWEAVASQVNFIAVEFTIMESPEGLHSADSREHFLFIAFDKRSDLVLFTTTFGHKSTEEVIEHWSAPLASEYPSEMELELLNGLGGLT